MRADRLCALLLATCALLAPRFSAAQEPDDRSEAARLYKQATTDFAAGRYESAARAFEGSHRLVPRAAALYSAARAWDAGGAVDRAADDYQDALEHTDLHGAEADDARKRLSEIGPLVAVVSVKAPDDALVWVGHVEGSLGGARTRVLPGDHEARAELAGHAPWRQAFHATAGGEVTLVASLEALPPAPAPMTPPPADSAAEAPRPKDRTWTWVALGIAAAGAVASGILYAETVHARDQFDASGDRDAHLRDTATSLRDATYAAYGVTGVAAAAGVTLYFVW